MERTDIVTFLKTFVKKQKSEVNYGTYRETTRSSLLNDGLSTRANSVWKQSQFIVAYRPDSDTETDKISKYLEGWRELTRGIYDQYLILECPKNVWTVFDKHGANMPLEDLKNVPQKYVEKDWDKDKHKHASRQIIYYGAPGTGKSHRIKEQLEGVPKENIIRTTFHPDSDYSTFVGAYKPTKGKRPLYGLNGGLTVRLNDGKDDLDEDIITYKFVPQAFLNAYMQAYREPNENVYLIIEEINRGNCAQIFGDLFQLLDRDENGKSEYTIKANTDLKAFLEEELDKDSEGIKDGELRLPSNLYIYATMNTSDQSLFPIDSAFKRRWDWEYEPIKYKNTDWEIDIDGMRYSWSDFQKKVNTRILKDTGSEDKMLGDYFVNPPAKVISYNLFRNKILFYLWNDVCKDGDADIFPTDEDFSFSKLYDEDSKQLIISIMDKLELKPINGDNTEDEDDMFEGEDNNSSSIRYSINGRESFQKTNLASELFKEYIKLYPDLSVEELISNWKNLEGKKPKHLIEDEIGYSTFIQESKGDRNKNERRFEQFDYKGHKVYLWKDWGDGPQGNILPFMELINKSNWGITIKRV